jgi:cytidine deaminase
VTGSNQENAAYPSGMCAERVALFSAGARYPDVPVKTVVIAAVKDGIVQKQIAPCGACRQVMLETEKRYNQPVQIVLAGSEEVYIVESAEALLPLSFKSF